MFKWFNSRLYIIVTLVDSFKTITDVAIFLTQLATEPVTVKTVTHGNTDRRGT